MYTSRLDVLSRSVLAVLTVAALTLVTSRATAQITWDPQRYMELVELGNQTFDEASELPEEMADERLRLFSESARYKQMTIEMLRGAILGGVFDEYGREFVDRASEDLFWGYQNLVVLFINMEFCQAAELKFNEAMRDVAILPLTAMAELEVLRPRVMSCGVEEDLSQVDPIASTNGTVGPILVETPDPPAREKSLLPWILVGVGGALLGTSIVYDLSMMGDGDDFEQLRDECALGPCDTVRLNELHDGLETAKVVVGTTLVAGLVAGAAGAVLLFLQGGEEPASQGDLGLTPMILPSGLGFSWSSSF